MQTSDADELSSTAKIDACLSLALLPVAAGGVRGRCGRQNGIARPMLIGPFAECSLAGTVACLNALLGDQPRQSFAISHWRGQCLVDALRTRNALFPATRTF